MRAPRSSVRGGGPPERAGLRLGRSFSIITETHQLVTSNPYRYVRHPLYLTKKLTIIGIFLQFASP